MAYLYISEYDRVGGVLPIASGPPLIQQKVEFSAAQSSAAIQHNICRLMVDADAHWLAGPPALTTATTNHEKLTAGVEYWRALTPGHKVSVIAAS